jgi:Putative amidoligase enzyme
MWKYLEGHYKFTANDFCGTHIHIGQEPGFKLRDLKRVAQAAIHFETAFEVLVPEERRGNPYTKSNWLNGTGLGEKNLSRSASIAAIEAVPDEADLDKLLGLLQPIDSANPYNLYDRAYCWNFLSLYKIDSIEFRKPPASLSSIETLSWAELALSFVQASTCAHLSSKELQKIPPNVGGLRGFLSKYGNEPGLNQTARLNRLFRGTRPGDSLPSVPIIGSRVLGLDSPGSVDLVAKAALDRMQMRQREAQARSQNGTS